MKQNYLKSFFARCLTLLILALLSTNLAWGDEATITFASQTSGTSDSGNEYSLSNFVSSGIDSSDDAFGTISCSATSKCYSGKKGYGLKAGASGKAGSFTISFTALSNVTKITLNAASYSASNKPCDIILKTGDTQIGNKYTTSKSSADFANAEFTPASTISSLSTLTVNTNTYCYIKSITVTYTSGPTKLSAPTGLQAENVTQTSADLSWTAVDNASSYTLAYKKTNDAEFTEKTFTNGSTLSGLSVGTEYTWKVKAVGDGTSYSTSDYSEPSTFTTVANVTYTVTFDAGENGTCLTEELTEASAGAGVELPSCTPNQGYAFLGWSTEENPTSADAGVAGETYKPTSNCTLYAYYGNLYSVTLKDTDPATVLTQETYGGSVELPSRTCVNPAYTFAGWSTTNVAKETETAPTIIPAGDYTPTASIELYPVFKRTVSSGEITWDVVTDASNLAAGDVVVITNADGTQALGAQSTNNRSQTAITVENDKITVVGEAQLLTLETGTKENTFAFNTSSGYLYAASSSSNYLRTQNDKNDNASFTVSISNKAATITAQGTYTHNILKYNSGSSCFSCYASGQAFPYIYKKNESSTTYYTSNPPTESLQDPVIAVAEGEYWGAMSVEITQSQGKEIYYTIDGTDPKVEGILYEAPVSITESCTLKAVAKDGEDYSGVVTAEYTIHPTTANVPVSEALTSAPEHWRQVGSWTFNNYGAVISGSSEAWLISPQIVKEKDTYAISYESASKEGAAGKLELYYSTDYDHSTNNYATATWIKIESCPNVSGGWTWTESTPTLTIDDNVTFAFKYTDNDKQWEFKNFSVVEKYGSQEDGTASFAEANIFVEKTKSADSPAITTNNTEGVKTYESGNTDVATVNATTGEVTAVSEGVATITVTIAENANYTECSASYTVTVTPEGNWWYEDWTGTTSETVIGTYDSRYSVTGEDTKVANNSYAGGVAPELLLNGTWTIDLSNDVLDGVYNLQYYSNGNPEVSVVGAAIGKANITKLSTTISKYVVPVVVSDYENFSIKFETQSNTRLDNIALILDHETKSFAKTISNRKMATLYLDYAVAIPEDVKAYTAKDKDDSHTAITLEKITDGVIPANTGVIVYADVEENTSFVFVETATTKTYDNNCLKGVTEKTAFDAVADYDAINYNYYALMAGEGTSVVFKLVSAGSYAANSAYLVLPKTNAAKVDFTFGDEPTGIESLTPALSEGKGVYNLQGVRVNNGYKGIVIMNGKKYINK